MKFILLIFFFILNVYAREYICENKSIPVNYVIVQRSIPTGECGSWESHVSPSLYTNFSKIAIETTEGKDTLTICEDQSIPVGFALTSKITSACCGSWRSGANEWRAYGAYVIKRMK